MSGAPNIPPPDAKLTADAKMIAGASSDNAYQALRWKGRALAAENALEAMVEATATIRFTECNAARDEAIAVLASARGENA